MTIQDLIEERYPDLSEDARREKILRLDKPILTVREAAEAHRVAVSTIYFWLRSGILFAYIDDGHWSVPSSSVLSVRRRRPGRPASLSEEDVRYIRSSHATGQQLAHKFGISQALVSAIRHGDRYADVA